MSSRFLNAIKQHAKSDLAAMPPALESAIESALSAKEQHFFSGLDSLLSDLTKAALNPALSDKEFTARVDKAADEIAAGQDLVDTHAIAQALEQAMNLSNSFGRFAKRHQLLNMQAFK